MEFGSSVLLWLATISIIVGCIGALVQTSIKRFFAYTSINQAGFIVLGVATSSILGLQASLVYLISYMIMLISFFAGVIRAKNTENIVDMKSLSSYSKFLVT